MSADAITESATTEADELVTLSDTAAAKVQQFLEGESDADALALRIAVAAGGCAGFRYRLFFDDRELDGDVVLNQHNVNIRVDEQSALYLKGAVIDWKESFEASGFDIQNPNATGTCACGDSASY